MQHGLPRAHWCLKVHWAVHLRQIVARVKGAAVKQRLQSKWAKSCIAYGLVVVCLQHVQLKAKAQTSQATLMQFSFGTPSGTMRAVDRLRASATTQLQPHQETEFGQPAVMLQL